MSDHHDDDAPVYSQTYITVWTILSAIVAGGIFLAFVFNHPLTHFFQWVWDLLRYLARPII
jgi:hypothetical protein